MKSIESGMHGLAVHATDYKEVLFNLSRRDTGAPIDNKWTSGDWSRNNFALTPASSQSRYSFAAGKMSTVRYLYTV